MAIPFIIGAIAVGTAAYGAKKGIDGYQDTKQAKKYHEEAKKCYEHAESMLNYEIETSREHFEKLGELQATIIDGALREYQDIIDKLEIKSNGDVGNFMYEEFGLEKIKESIASLQTVLASVVGGVAGGVAAGFGAFGCAGLLASASTGTAISALSGAAATKATLAWFGGGSLATGGFGIAGGTLVLGGIVAAPVILVSGSVFAASAEKKKYDAQAYLDSVRTLSLAMNAQSLSWKHMGSRIVEKINSLEKIHKEIKEHIICVSYLMTSKGYEVSLWSKDDQNLLKRMVQFAETLINIINSPLMADEDKTTQELKKHQEECQILMDEINAKWGN